MLQARAAATTASAKITPKLNYPGTKSGQNPSKSMYIASCSDFAFIVHVIPLSSIVHVIPLSSKSS
jgi:hypothetical protein